MNCAVGNALFCHMPSFFFEFLYAAEMVQMSGAPLAQMLGNSLEKFGFRGRCYQFLPGPFIASRTSAKTVSVGRDQPAKTTNATRYPHVDRPRRSGEPINDT